MQLIRRGDTSEIAQELLFSRLQQVIPPHRKNDALPEEETESENDNDDNDDKPDYSNPAETESDDKDETEDDDKPDDSDFQSRLRAALGAARAFHRCSFE